MIEPNPMVPSGRSGPVPTPATKGRKLSSEAPVQLRRVLAGPASAMNRQRGRRIVIRPFFGPTEGLDITDILIAAVARELSRRYGGNEPLNRLEAERLLLDAL